VTELHPTAARVQGRLRGRGLDVEVREMPDSTRTAADAAVGCEIGQIVKTLVFVAGGEPVVVLCAGDRRVDASRIGDDVRTARADEVREATGYAIGGVPPLGHDRELPTLVDESLRRFGEVWCAAGTPRAVFAVAVDDLLRVLPDAEVRSVSA
jgi:prolyl-tRNA editing enzyme YbaK/EbsC (Cys-tRNA(Pro) deacylase)